MPFGLGLSAGRIVPLLEPCDFTVTEELAALITPPIATVTQKNTLGPVEINPRSVSPAAATGGNSRDLASADS